MDYYLKLINDNKKVIQDNNLLFRTAIEKAAFDEESDVYIIFSVVEFLIKILSFELKQKTTTK